MFLARTVFHCTVHELKQRLTEHEFCQWMAYHDLDPWGNEWLQTGTIASAIAATIPKSDSTQVTPMPEDFVPYRYEEDKPGHIDIHSKVKELKKRRAERKAKAEQQKLMQQRSLYSPVPTSN